jgi:hypothetical protein
MPSRLQIAKPDISAFFQKQADNGERIFNSKDIGRILSENRDSWRLAQRTTVADFTSFLCERAGMRRVEIKSETLMYKGFTRFIWKEATPYEVALSLKKGAYLSHYSAVTLHDLTDQLISTIYINKEQSPKGSASGMSQEGINRAFSRPQRESQYRFRYDQWSIVIISGKYTRDYEVGTLRGPVGEDLPATKLERTLIDITVRPTYAGGVFEVLNAFERARDNVSVNKLLAVLKTLNYAYPYHQAIGFYMQRANYEPRFYERLKDLGLEYDFYLAHDLGPTDYDPNWRLHVPKGM